MEVAGLNTVPIAEETFKNSEDTVEGGNFLERYSEDSFKGSSYSWIRLDGAATSANGLFTPLILLLGSFFSGKSESAV